jgi:hypothetical protein
MEEITPETAKSEAAEIMADRDGAYWNKGHHAHTETVEHVSSLMAAQHGDGNAIAEDGDSTVVDGLMTDAMTAPDQPSAYDFKGVQFDDEIQEDTARGWFYEAGLSVDEQKMLTDRAIGLSTKSAAENQQMAESASRSLQRLWGNAFDQNVNSVERVIDHLGPQFRSALVKSGANNDFSTITTLLRVAKSKGM